MKSNHYFQINTIIEVTLNWFSDLPRIYLHCTPVDFRKAVNGLSEVVAQELSMNPFDESLYVFCNRGRDIPLRLTPHRGIPK